MKQLKLSKIITFIMMFFLSMPLFAQDVVAYRADAAVIYEETGVTTLTGNVSLKRGNLDMKSDVVEVFAETKANGDEEFTKMNGRGNVVAKSGARIITSSNMTYDAKTEIAVFTGNVSIKNGKNTAKGSRAEVNMATGVHRLVGPVSGTISGSLP